MVYLGLFLIVCIDNAARLFVPPGTFAGATLPDLPLLTALFLGFRARNTGHLGYAALLGVFADCLSSCPLGHFAFLYGAAAYAAWRIRRFLPPDAGLGYVVATLFCALITGALATLIALLSPAGTPWAGAADFGIRSVASAFVAPLVFLLLEKSSLFRRALGGRSYYELAG